MIPPAGSPAPWASGQSSASSDVICPESAWSAPLVGPFVRPGTGREADGAALAGCLLRATGACTCSRSLTEAPCWWGPRASGHGSGPCIPWQLLQHRPVAESLRFRSGWIRALDGGDAQSRLRQPARGGRSSAAPGRCAALSRPAPAPSPLLSSGPGPRAASRLHRLQRRGREAFSCSSDRSCDRSALR